jgi:hypothetical protein
MTAPFWIGRFFGGDDDIIAAMHGDVLRPNIANVVHV